MLTSPNLDKIAPALLKAQTDIKPVIKDATNPHFKSKYADLPAVVEEARSALLKHGITFHQSPEIEGNAVRLTTRLMHESGQWIEGTAGAIPKDMQPQSVGAAITYLRRYGLSSMCGIVADDDDDGNGKAKRAKVDTAGVEKDKLPKWSAEEKERGGAVRARFMTIGGDPWIKDVHHRMKYDEPKVTLAYLDGINAKWNDSLYAQAVALYEQIVAGDGEGDMEAVSWGWNWSDPTDVIEKMTKLKATL